jgi:hypothetical protein
MPITTHFFLTLDVNTTHFIGLSSFSIFRSPKPRQTFHGPYISLAEDCGGTSGVDFRLIWGLENDWAAVDSPLRYS